MCRLGIIVEEDCLAVSDVDGLSAVVSASSYVLLVYAVPVETSAEKSMLAVSSINICSKCVINKAGTRSCCGRGGAWFKNCGDAGDTNFDHTWAEGIHACVDFPDLISDGSPPQVRDEGGIVDPLNNDQPRNDFQHQDRRISGSNAGIRHSEHRVGLLIFVFVMYVC